MTEQPLVENLNRFDGDVIEASGIDDAIKALRFVLFWHLRCSGNTASDDVDTDAIMWYVFVQM